MKGQSPLNLLLMSKFIANCALPQKGGNRYGREAPHLFYSPYS